VPLLLYALVLVILFADVLFLHRTLDPSPFVPKIDGTRAALPGKKGPVFCNDAGAVVWAYQPWNILVHRSLFEDGEIPLWNPYQGTGTPLAANFQSGVFSPLQWPFFFSTSRAWWDLLFVARLLLAGVFTFLFLRRIEIPFASAWLGGLAYMLTGYLIDYINMNHLAVPLLLPSAFYFAESWRKVGRSRHFLGTVLSLSLMVLAGMPEASLLAWLLLAGFISFELIQDGSPLREWLSWLLVFTLAVLVAGILLVPGLEYLSLAHSKHFVQEWGTRSFDLRSVIGLWIPYFFGPPGDVGWSPAFDKAFDVPSGIGVLAFSLSIAGVLSSRLRLRWFFAGCAGLGLLKLFGFPILNAAGFLPVLRLIIFTKYLQPEIAFSLAVLAAIGFSTLRPGNRSALVIAAAAGGFWALTVGFTSFNADAILKAQPLLRLGVAASVLFALLLCASSAAAGYLLYRGWGKMPAVIFALTTLELFGLAVRLHPDRPVNARETAQIAEKVKSLGQAYRLTGGEVLLPNEASRLGVLDLRVLDPLLPANLGSALTELAGQPIQSRFSGDEFTDYDHPALDWLGVRYILSRRDVRNLLLRTPPPAPDPADEPGVSPPDSIPLVRVSPSSHLQFQIPDRSEVQIILKANAGGILQLKSGSRVLLRKSYRPGATLFGPFDNKTLDVDYHSRVQIETAGIVQLAVVSIDSPGGPALVHAGDVAAGIQIFERPRARPIAWVTDRKPALGKSIDDWPRLDRDAGTPAEESIQVVRRTANQLELRSPEQAGGYLVIARTFFPGWTCRINGKPVPLERLGSLLTGVPVPAGRLQVVLRYSPNSVWIGLLLTLSGLLLTGIMTWRVTRPCPDGILDEIPTHRSEPNEKENGF